MDSNAWQTIEKLKIETKGIEALKRLLILAQSNNSSWKYVARFLICLNKNCQINMFYLNSIEQNAFEDILSVLRMIYRLYKDHRLPLYYLHDYIENGEQLLEDIEKRFADDFSKRTGLKFNYEIGFL